MPSSSRNISTVVSPPLRPFASRLANPSWWFRNLTLCCALFAVCAPAQTPAEKSRAKKFVAARKSATSPAEALANARAQQAYLPRNTAPWTAVGPVSIVSTTYGNLSGRVTALALDPSDTTGNTLYVGTTGGGVWKSVNALAASPTFSPLTDTLPVFSQSAGSSAIPSLSIGALAVQPVANPVLLAGTGDPNDATDSLYGEGILRSTDGGATWTLVQTSQDLPNGEHFFYGLAAAGFAWSTISTQLVVAAFSTSAEAAIVSATGSTSVPGLYYSTDAGLTWKMATLYDGAALVQAPESTPQVGNAVTSVVWDALRGSFYAAVRGHGYYASADGITWQRMTTQPGTGLTAANCPANSAAATCPIFRGTLAVQPTTGDLYALTVDDSDADQGLWQDLCHATSGVCSNGAPVFATRLDGGAMEAGSGSTVIAQGDYNQALAAVPTATGTLLFAGTIDLYRCALSAGATGCALRNTTNAINGCTTPAGVAPAQHALAAFGASTIFLGNDGGLWRSTDGVAETGSACSASDASHFTNLNATLGSLSEVVGFAQSPTDANTLIAGLGANGSAATSTAQSAWTQLSAGEGGFPLLDPATPTNWYAAIGAGVNVKQCTLGALCAASNFAGAATIGAAQVAYDATLLDAPVLLDPALTSNIIIATCRVWRGPAGDGTQWSASNAISAAIGGGATPCTTSSPLIRSLGAGGPAAASLNAQSAGSTVLYAGMSAADDGGTTALSGHVVRTEAANLATNTTAWTDIATSPVTNDSANAGVFNPNGFDVSSVTVDAHDATGATVYATIMGFGVSAPHVYRSTDFGAHWLNISSNLPSAPVNALVVDPNDANTVYVASDTGVYVTQSIATCSTTVCWNLMGTGLPNAPVTTLSAAANMPTGDGRKGMLRAGTYGRGLWQTPLLTAISPAAPAITLSATSLTFASQQVGTQSAAQNVTLTNSGNAPLLVSTLSMSGDFTETDTCAAQTIAVAATCKVSVVFAPSVTGARTGTLTLYANIAGGQATVALSGTATSPATILLTPTSLSFPSTTVNQTAASQIVNIANTGGTSATLQTPVITGDFAITGNTCSATLAATTACAVSISFTPTASGARTGTLSLTDSAGTQTASLTGTGNAPATDTLAPLALAFSQQIVGTASATQNVTLTNAGSVPLTLITATSSSSEFTVTNGCGASLSGPSSCAISVAFVPSATGPRTATLTVSDQYRSQTVALTGTAVAPAGVSLTPTSLSFGPVGLGLTSSAQTLTLTNNGGVPLVMTSFTPSGDFVLASTTCGTTLAVNASCTATLVFAPTAGGARVGALTIVDNAPGGTQTATLTGTGVDFTLTASGATTATIAASGGSATFPLLLSSASGLMNSVALTCSGAPSHTTCKVTPSSATLGGTTMVSAVVTTGVASAAVTGSRDALPWMRGGALLLALAVPCCLLRRKRLPLMMFFVCAALTSCGTGRVIPGDAPIASTPSPTGTYTLQVTATSAGLTHSVSLTVTVQ